MNCIEKQNHNYTKKKPGGGGLRDAQSLVWEQSQASKCDVLVVHHTKTTQLHEKSHQDQFHRYGACVNILYARDEKA